MLRHLTEWLKDVAGMWMLIGILTITLVVFSIAKRVGFTANVKISSINQELNELSYEKYDGINLTGSEVMNAIKRYQEELPVTVYTGESVDTYKGSFKPANNNRKSEKYIKPSQIYTGSLLKNAEKEIVGLVFAKEGIMLTETSYKELLAKIVGANPEDSKMEDLVSRINDLIKNKDTTITALNQNISSLNNSISNLQTQNSTLNTQISTEKHRYNTLLEEVNAGKKSIAAALTEKGVASSATDSLSSMANNIRNISSSFGCKIIEEQVIPREFSVRVADCYETRTTLLNGGGKDSTGFYIDKRLNTKKDPKDIVMSMTDGYYAYVYPCNYRKNSYVYKGADGYCYLRSYASYYQGSWGECIYYVSGSHMSTNVYYLSD